MLIESPIAAALAAVWLCGEVATLAGTGFVVSSIFLIPGWLSRSAAGQAQKRVSEKRSELESGLTESAAMDFCRRLRGCRWSSSEVTPGVVFLVISAAALLSVLVAGNVLGLRRPEVAEEWLPWILGLALLASMSEAWTRPTNGHWLRIAVIVLALAALMLITVVKVEATVVPAGTYAKYHPLKDALLYPAWIAIELTLFLGAAVLGHAGVDNAVRLVGWTLGLLGEALLCGLILVVALAGFALQFILHAIHLLLGMVFMPAAMAWEALRRHLGTDLDGNFRLPALPGERVS